jgi:hypothetical protein
VESKETPEVNGRNGLKMQVSMSQYYLYRLNQEQILMLRRPLITSNQ